MVCGIYVIHNLINGKKYIGQSVDVYQRLSKHKSNLRNNYQSPNAHLQNAWNKYGERAFDFGILKACKPRYLDRFEKLYIRAWDLQNPNYGYNKESGGKVCKNITQETRNKISQQWRNPNSLYNSETYRQTLRDKQRSIIKKAWSNPDSKYNSIEFRLKQSQLKKMHGAILILNITASNSKKKHQKPCQDLDVILIQYIIQKNIKNIIVGNAA